MKLVIRSFSLTAAVLLIGAQAASAQSSFAPLTKWTAAVTSGDAPAVRSFYSSDPPAMIVIGREQNPQPDLDAKYWAGLKSEGLYGINPKILSEEITRDQARLIMRVQGQKYGQTMVSSLVQIWAQQPNGWHIVATQRSPFVPDNGRQLPEPAKPNPALYPTPQESLVELKAAMARAGREHKRVLLVFGANWCYDCHVLDTTFHSKEFAPLLQQNYVVSHVSIGDEGKDNNDLAARLGVNVEGVPALAILDPDGKVVAAQQNHEFAATAKISPDDIRAFLQKYKPAH